MKIIKHCKKCGKNKVVGYKCEVCNKTNFYDAITVNFGYGHYLDGKEFHFCGNMCTYKFFAAEIKKGGNK